MLLFALSKKKRNVNFRKIVIGYGYMQMAKVDKKKFTKQKKKVDKKTIQRKDVATQNS